MSTSSYGRKLNPHRVFREARGIKANRLSCVTTNDPAEIAAGSTLLVKFPSLESNEVFVPGTARLAFNITLDSKDLNRTVCNNLGRALIEKLVIRAGTVEIFNLTDYGKFTAYRDLWKSSAERIGDQYQGVDTSENRNVTKLRLHAEDADDGNPVDKAIADTYGNRFCIPLDHEILESHMPFYQSGLNDRLTYEITFAKHDKVIQAKADSAASYKINNICLEYDKVVNADLASTIRSQYLHGTTILYKRVHRKDMVVVQKSATTLKTISIPEHARSLKGVLLLFQEPSTSYAYNSEKFYNPQIEKVSVSINGSANQLYERDLLPYNQWEETRKFFAAGPGKRHPESSMVLKDLYLSDVTLGEFLTDKYALWLDMRTSDDDLQHGSGRPLRDGGGMSIQITKKQTGTGDINMYVFLVQDAQLIIKDGRFQTAEY